MDLLRYTVIAFGSLLPLVNPINATPIFAALMSDQTDAQRNSQARKAGVYTFAILAVTTLAGAVLLDFFGLTLGMLQIAGGLIVGQAAWALVTGNPQASQQETSAWEREQRFSLRRLFRPGRGEVFDEVGPLPDEPQPPVQEPRPPAPLRDIAFSPTAMPILAGPAAMGVVIGLASQSETVTGDLGILLGVGLISVLCAWGLRTSNTVLRVLGQSGILALQRVFGLLLLAISVSMLANGISDLFGVPLSTR